MITRVFEMASVFFPGFPKTFKGGEEERRRGGGKEEERCLHVNPLNTHELIPDQIWS